ncbi:MAG: S-layer y protein [Cohnella sp.]|nr:S-layer y protein [Cohnella sp.]
MQQKVPAWKKTAVATVALSMLAGSATGLVASAKEHGNNEGNHGKSKHDKQGDKFSKNVKVNYRLDFNDLNEKQWKWAYQEIIRLVAQGVFKGYDDGSFKPNNKITRLETIVAAVRLLGLEAEAQKPENMNATLNFKDFDQLKSKNPQAVGYVKIALANDLFNENDTTIQGDKPATRLWASVLLVKAMKLEAEAQAKMDTQLPFRDSNEVPAGSVGYVAVAIDKGLVAGYSDNSFQPNKPVSRAELAAILARLGVQLPGQENNNGALTGVVQVNANGTITVKKSDNTTVNFTLNSDVFIFRNGVKVPVSALQVGDELSIRISQGQVIFIEVTKQGQPTTPVTQLNDTGRVSSFTLNSQNKLATLSITKDVNGTATTIVYNVDANVTITGGSGVLAPNLIVVVAGENNVVKSIQIQP